MLQMISFDQSDLINEVIWNDLNGEVRLVIEELLVFNLISFRDSKYVATPKGIQVLQKIQ